MTKAPSHNGLQILFTLGVADRHQISNMASLAGLDRPSQLGR